ncbi:GNAT family N-acetyltransferase [Lactococcus allomyrinae]|uniref:GNAT family N-acetyltransferase n=1 Tax=Lactococcus allomyrinae TaxID=2419773 RepID=A0A387BC86_9LACT|nr:GNAT family N-acetyltransferase [Lactococcus allomyrinae]AYG00068.1 GNAT family N-acetyltransferase [Lactococcus allomyrinae]
MKIIKAISEQLIIKELAQAEFEQAYPLVHQLRQDLPLTDFLSVTAQMQDYRVFVLTVADKIIAYAGFAEQLNLYEGRHIFVYELVTDVALRGQGYGKILLSALTEEGKRLGCEMLVLTSGLQRVDAHRFYEEKMKLMRTSFVFRKEL